MFEAREARKAARAAKKLAKLGGVDIMTFSDTVTELKQQGRIIGAGCVGLAAINIAYVAINTKRAHQISERAIDALAENTELVNSIYPPVASDDDDDDFFDDDQDDDKEDAQN